MCAALAAFALASFSAYILPQTFVRSSLYLLPLITTLTYGFVNLSSALAAIVGQVPISSPFYWPWLSPSLASFWAHRWNAPIASALRAGVYDPLVDHANAPRAVATIACFVASGAGHVALLYYVRQVPGMPLWFMFFCVHGVFVCLERLVLDAKLVKSRLQWRMWSTMLMLGSTELLFVPAFRDSRLFDDAVYELATAFRIFENISVLAFRMLASGQSRTSLLV
jgi:Membrane bound O-acyl transferase family